MEKEGKKRVAVYVDGFNLYHAMHSWIEKIHEAPEREDHSIKWLDLRQLAERFCNKEETLVGIHFFSARGWIRIPYADKETEKDIKERQKTYIEALKKYSRVECYISDFGLEKRKCRFCGKIEKRRREKQTDVKLALQVFKDVVGDIFDVGILVSGDSDFFPVLKEALIFKEAPKIMKIAIPANRAIELVSKIKKQEQFLYKKLETNELEIIKILIEDLLQCRLPESMRLPDGKILQCPEKYRPR